MDGPARDQQAEAWSAGAAGYETAFAPYTFPYSREALRLLGVGPATRLLDVAAGSGAVTLQALELGADVVATDFAPGMVELLSRRLAERGHANVAVEVMDGQALELDDASFDVAISMLGLIFFPDIDAGVRELVRVTRSGGQVAVGVWDLDQFRLVALVQAAVARALPDFVLPTSEPTWARIGHADGLVSLFEQHGLRDVVVHPVTQWWRFDDPVEFFLQLPSWSPPVQPLFDALGPDVLDRVAAAFVDVVAESSGPEGLRADVLVAIGRR
ncbi:MAG: class I SAM-dependent methyltransferase [Acidimicrobiales bacterium]